MGNGREGSQEGKPRRGFRSGVARRQDVGMDPLREFLEAIRQHKVAQGNLRGLLHVLIGRRISRSDGTAISGGLTWREAAALLREARWDREAVAEEGLNTADLPPRDRQRFWYTVIQQAGVDSPVARAAGDRLIGPLQALGYEIGPAPGGKKSRSEPET